MKDDYVPCRDLEIHPLPVFGPDIVRYIQFTVEIGSRFRPHDAEVDELDTSIWCEMDIVRLDVAVRNQPRLVVKIG